MVVVVVLVGALVAVVLVAALVVVVLIAAPAVRRRRARRVLDRDQLRRRAARARGQTAGAGGQTAGAGGQTAGAGGQAARDRRRAQWGSTGRGGTGPGATWSSGGDGLP